MVCALFERRQQELPEAGAGRKQPRATSEAAIKLSMNRRRRFGVAVKINDL
jgi:hypothetical protein